MPAVGAYYGISTAGETLLSAAASCVRLRVCVPALKVGAERPARSRARHDAVLNARGGAPDPRRVSWQLARRRPVGILPAAAAAGVSRRCGGGSAISGSGSSIWSSPPSSSRRRTPSGRSSRRRLAWLCPPGRSPMRWVSFVAAFLLLDFLHYAVHRCQHAVPFLWRFHALHHSDPDVDVTTSVRHHPIEYLIGSGFYWLAVIAARYSSRRRAEPRARGIRRRRRPARQHPPAGAAGAVAAAGVGHGRHAPHPPLRRVRTRRTAITAPFSRSGIGCSGPTPG